MVKKGFLHPPHPRRAETRPFPGFIFTSLKDSTYTVEYASPFRSLRLAMGRGASWRAWRGWVEYNHFDHPARGFSLSNYRYEMRRFLRSVDGALAAATGVG